jgi:capsid protein
MFDNVIADDLRDRFIAELFKPYGVELGPGIVNFLKPGETINAVTPSQPNASFGDFTVAMSRFIGAAVGIPYEILLKQFNASYSASRAALLEFWKRVKMHRQLVVDQFCQPVYEDWIDEALALGVIRLFRGRLLGLGDPAIRYALCRCNWGGISAGSLDPLREAMAAEKRINLFISTIEREAIELNGSDWRVNLNQAQIEGTSVDAAGFYHPALRDVAGRPI